MAVKRIHGRQKRRRKPFKVKKEEKEAFLTSSPGR
jgi:hypothetical protein